MFNSLLAIIVVAYLIANLLGYRLSRNSYRYRRTLFFYAQALEQALREANASRKSAEASNLLLYKAKKHYRLLVQNSHGIIYEIQPDGVFVFVSSGWTRSLGHDVSDVVSHDFRTFVHPDDIAVCEVFQQKTVATGEVHEGIEYRVLHQDGSTRWHKSNIMPRFNDSNEIISFVGNAVDITDQKRYQAELEQARIVAEASNKAKTDFLAMISHEIRTPLNALIGFSTLAQQTTDTDRRIEYLGILEGSSRILMDLVNNVLDMSRIESGQLNLELFPFNLTKLLARITNHHAPLAAQKGLEFKVSYASDIPQWVIGDSLRLQQILTNLISNAIKFTQTGGITCTVEMAQPQSIAQPIAQRSDGYNSPLHIAVHDSGIGIPEDKLPLLFQPFQQLFPGITRRYGGSGLGLAIVHRLVTLMDGRIDVSSHEGGGTCFSLIIPMQVATAPLLLRHNVSVTKPMHILVVDDNAFNRRLLTDTLSAWKHVVTQAQNAQQALTLKRQNDYDLVILDIRMPDIDGIELTRQLRRMEQDGSTAPAPIIAITADTLESTRLQCMNAGINTVLFKPLDPAKLAIALADRCNTHDWSGVAGADMGIGNDQCHTSDWSGESLSGRFLNQSTMADMGYDVGQMAEYQSLLFNDIADELNRLIFAIDNQDRTTAGDAAHTLKGLCGHLCEPLPWNLASQLHLHTKTATFEQLGDMAASMRASCTLFLDMNLQLEKTR
jgi:PAS domain S-box-containing protein